MDTRAVQQNVKRMENFSFSLKLVGIGRAKKTLEQAPTDGRSTRIHTLHGTRFSQTYCRVLPTLPSAATIILSTFRPTSWHPLFVSLLCTFSPSKFQIRIRQLFSETAASGRHMGSTRERASCIAKEHRLVFQRFKFDRANLHLQILGLVLSGEHDEDHTLELYEAHASH